MLHREGRAFPPRRSRVEHGSTRGVKLQEVGPAGPRRHAGTGQPSYNRGHMDAGFAIRDLGDERVLTVGGVEHRTRYSERLIRLLDRAQGPGAGAAVLSVQGDARPALPRAPVRLPARARRPRPVRAGGRLLGGTHHGIPGRATRGGQDPHVRRGRRIRGDHGAEGGGARPRQGPRGAPPRRGGDDAPALRRRGVRPGAGGRRRGAPARPRPPPLRRRVLSRASPGRTHRRARHAQPPLSARDALGRAARDPSGCPRAWPTATPGPFAASAFAGCRSRSSTPRHGATPRGARSCRPAGPPVSPTSPRRPATAGGSSARRRARRCAARRCPPSALPCALLAAAGRPRSLALPYFNVVFRRDAAAR